MKRLVLLLFVLILALGLTGCGGGKKKGNQATLDGSFTIYANDQNGPSVTIKVDGTYVVDEEGYCETDDHMFYYLYQDGQFTVSDRETVMGF